MKRDMTILYVLIAIMLQGVTGCGTARQTQDLRPDEVFTVTQEDIARETLRVNRAIQGEWKYSGPSVDVSGKNLLAGVGKPIAKSKLKKKIKSAFNKIGLNKACPQFTFNEDGSCVIRLLGANLNGRYNYNPGSNEISFKWHGVPITARLKPDGKKKMHLTFEADKLLKLLSLASKFSDSSAIKALGTLLDNYEDINVGFELKK
ncbi:MAG: DUF4923 family protein [Muribaculaceae bacterium]|nr:DUF4923 family protein [Muribaculaceae bacterium]